MFWQTKKLQLEIFFSVLTITIEILTNISYYKMNTQRVYRRLLYLHSSFLPTLFRVSSGPRWHRSRTSSVSPGNAHAHCLRASCIYSYVFDYSSIGKKLR